MTRILTLMDNSSGPVSTLAEHGLSFYIEHEGQTLLFDTGRSAAFLHNASTLKVNLEKLEAVVLSHAHYDHGGGLRALYEQLESVPPLWTGPCFFDKKYSNEASGLRYLGLDFDESFLSEQEIPQYQVEGSLKKTVKKEILDSVYLINGFARSHTIEKIAPRFVVQRDGKIVEDDFMDEVCLVLDKKDGILVILGCAHPGIMNMLASVLALFQKPLLAVLGGSHLVEADEERRHTSLSYLERLACPLLALGHCTGDSAAKDLRALRAYRPLSVAAEFCI
ncbi:MBL fold metallo-hydrolase [Treponema sp.]